MHDRFPFVYICIPLHNRVRYTAECLASIRQQSYPNIVTIVCDDGSTDETAIVLARDFPEVHVITAGGDLWWTGGMNACIRKALSLAQEGDYIYTLNNDTVLQQDTIEKLLGFLMQRSGSIVGTLNLFFDDPSRIENSAFVRDGWRGMRRLHKWAEVLGQQKGVVQVNGLSGKGVLIPVSALIQLGLFNQEALPHYHADLEFFIRAERKGWKIFLHYDAKLLSHQNLSGIGSVTSDPDIGEFLKSFTSIRSTHHLSSLWNFLKLTRGHFFPLHFVKDLALIWMGFTRRYLKRLFKIK